LPTTRVLVIDDEPALSAVVRRLLRGEHEVVGFTDAREALERLKGDPTFDVVLCDLMMPNMSGSDFYERLSARLPQLAARTVFMTGGAFNSAAKEFLRRVIHPVLEKPFETQALHEAIARVLEAQAISGTWLKANIEQAM
jgi:CheY-like chemotaxis protein